MYGRNGADQLTVFVLTVAVIIALFTAHLLCRSVLGSFSDFVPVLGEKALGEPALPTKNQAHNVLVSDSEANRKRAEHSPPLQVP